MCGTWDFALCRISFPSSSKVSHLWLKDSTFHFCKVLSPALQFCGEVQVNVNLACFGALFRFG